MTPAKIYLYGGIAAAGALLVYLLVKKQPGESLATTAGRQVVAAAADAAVGVVKGIGAAVGIPDTNDEKCTVDLANGDFWAASFSCPASRLMGGSLINDRQIDRIIEREQANTASNPLGAVLDPATGEQIGMYDEMGNRIY